MARTSARDRRYHSIEAQLWRQVSGCLHARLEAGTLTYNALASGFARFTRWQQCLEAFCHGLHFLVWEFVCLDEGVAKSLAAVSSKDQRAVKENDTERKDIVPVSGIAAELDVSSTNLYLMSRSVVFRLRPQVLSSCQDSGAGIDGASFGAAVGACQKPLS